MIARGLLALGAICAVTAASAETDAELKEQVWKTEVAFAKTMADRDHAGFTSFLASEAIFFSADGKPDRGATDVARAWKPLYEAKAAPFSWEPEQVEVLESGTLAISSGPVKDPRGNRVATFTSIWRRQSDGQWKIVFDKGCRACACAQ